MINGFAAVRNFTARRFSVGLPTGQLAPQALEPLAVDRADAARMLSVSESTLRRLVARGELREKKVGRKAIYVVEELRDYLKK